MIRPNMATQETKNIPLAGMLKINSRFGEVDVDAGKSIFFPQGLYGLPENLTFALTKFPNDKFSSFSLLQCLDDYSLSFVVLPASVKNTIVEADDIVEAASQYDIKSDEVAVLFIVSVQRSPEKTYLTVNAKAPILVDTAKQEGVQHILTSPKYSVKYEVE